MYKACKDLPVENYQVNNRLFYVIIRRLSGSFLIIIRRYHVSMTPRLAPAAPALASSRPCSVEFLQLGSGCSNHRHAISIVAAALRPHPLCLA